ncbi:Eco57I restriction-modification methylase domain-containing protein [Megamonas funiformis]|uniref:Eco57I restriction-modification methylase domain-containing protein n=1 Tax=Megamonas funiformis TaxID=437897 RepID=UPI001C6FCF19|nr:Eco57I restriction-modification methylase domain-containing protein [Megamonas funiformis]
MENISFENVFSYKLIYILAINDEAHEGLLKIGDATLKTDQPIEKLIPNCSLLNKSAKKRIETYTNTAGIDYKLLYTQLAVKKEKDKIDKKDKLVAFRDYEVHNVLKASNIKPEKLVKSREWFRVDLETAKKAIEAVINNEKNLLKKDIKAHTPIIFRPEQEEAIDKTVKLFTSTKKKEFSKMLWNAKMRFGKTVSALEVIRQCKFNKTIIITHRPVVDKGWEEDFNKIFYNEKNFIYGSKKDSSLKELIVSKKKFVYFASIQDLRNSKTVGGIYDKNDDVFDTEWDLVIVDEAHEGTTTALGDEVIKRLVKSNSSHNTKFLALSGTPFNIIDEYNDEKCVYTWDYIMEQDSKEKWSNNYFGDSNPYEELPKMHIYTYNLGELLKTKYVEDKAFNFKEFFRTWTGNIKIDLKPMPKNANIGDFVHENDIISFLNLITKKDSQNNYPFATEKYRDLFRHTLWMVPGVKEAKALSELMKSHPVFGSTAFNIVNVAGDGDSEEENKDALNLVKTAIKEAGTEGYTITLSCGKLTTGVTIREWTAVMMLAGAYSTSASTYLQTIFRVQSPCNMNGKIKTDCYVFDFAPDRALKVIAESVNISTKPGRINSEEKQKILGAFLNYCPVISLEGTKMKKLSTSRLLQRVKRVYAEKAIKNGFDDDSLYSDELLKLQNVDVEKFKGLQKILEQTKSLGKTKQIDINKQGLTDEEYEELERLEKKQKKNKKELTPEEKEDLERRKEILKNKAIAKSILRSISIRIPLLIYGANIAFNEDITIENLTELVDDVSWQEFMPKGVTKDLFKEFIKYYDKEVFIVAGLKIRDIVKSADDLPILERIKEITKLFSYFKNPDKETVLTPWRVVNMHMSDCLGGYDFFDEEHLEEISEPRLVNRGQVTKDIFDKKDTHILEVNSKTGLYPLYMTYSIYRYKLKRLKAVKNEISTEDENNLWIETIRNNIFVICKTKMAKYITNRTLLGYKQIDSNSKIGINAHCFDDLLKSMTDKPESFIKRIQRVSFWLNEGNGIMKFDAIVGNPPYMIMDGGAKASAKPIYNYFIESSKKVEPRYMSFIIPTRWYTGGKGLDDFRKSMLNDKHMELIHDYLTPEYIFSNTNIRGGVCYFLWNKDYNNEVDLIRVVTHQNEKIISDIKRKFKIKEVDIFIRDAHAIAILDRILKEKNIDFMTNYISSRKPFGIDGNFTESESFLSDKNELANIECYGKAKSIGYIKKDDVKNHKDWISVWKVYMPYVNNIGTELNDDNQNTFIGEPNSVCTETFLVAGAELNLNKYECIALSKYLRSKFARFLHSLAKTSHHATAKTYQFVPLQDFSDKSDIDWSKSIAEIDQQLYVKYKFSKDEIDYVESKIKPMAE